MADRFNARAFALALHARRFAAGLTMRDLATGVGFKDHKAIFRAERGLSVGVEKFLRLCRYFNEDPRAFLMDEAGRALPPWPVVPRGTMGETEGRASNGGAVERKRQSAVGSRQSEAGR